MNAFECLGLKPSFDLDMAALEQAYFALQRTHHPDRQAAGQRVAELLSSMQINEAYQTLKSPLKRVQHLLKLHGFDVLAEKGGVIPSPALLNEAMEQREALAEAQTALQLEAVRKQALAQQEKCVAALSKLCAAQQWGEAAQATLRLGYIEKLLEECRRLSHKMSA